MSKCRPELSDSLRSLLRKGLKFEDKIERPRFLGMPLPFGEKQRYVTIKIPYELLRDDKEVQKEFQGIVKISIKK